jgi:hypothetical protein
MGLFVSKDGGRQQTHTSIAEISLGGGCSLGLLGGLSRSRRSLSRLLFLGGITSWASFTLTTIRRSPERQVVPKQLHDERAVTVGLLGERVEFGDRIVKGLLSQVAGTIGRIEDFVVEYGEVESQSEANRVGRSQLGLCDIGGILNAKSSVLTVLAPQTRRMSYLVGFVSGSGGNLALLTGCELSQVTVIVALPNATISLVYFPVARDDAHLVVEDLGLARLGFGDEGLVEDIEDILADFLELGLDLLAVFADGADVLV